MISKTKQKGFTIVELLIVIVVIGILAAISIVAYNNVTQKARDDQRVSDVRNIVNAAASYNAENGHWPTDAQLKAFNTIKLSGTAASRLTAVTGSTTPAVTLANKDSTYNYRVCGTTGVEVAFYKEAPVSPETNNVKISTGTGC